MEIEKFSSRLKELIARDQVNVVIQELSFLLRNSEKLNEVILTSSRYNDLQNQIRIGLIDYNQAAVSKNRIIIEILEILDELEDSIEENEELKKEVEKLEEPNITASKNVVQGSSIDVGGDFRVGDINISTSGTTENTKRIIEILKKKKSK